MSDEDQPAHSHNDRLCEGTLTTVVVLKSIRFSLGLKFNDLNQFAKVLFGHSALLFIIISKLLDSVYLSSRVRDIRVSRPTYVEFRLSHLTFLKLLIFLFFFLFLREASFHNVAVLKVPLSCSIGLVVFESTLIKCTIWEDPL